MLLERTIARDRRDAMFWYRMHRAVRPYWRPCLTRRDTPLLFKEIESLFPPDFNVSAFCSVRIEPALLYDEAHRFVIHVDVDAEAFEKWRVTQRKVDGVEFLPIPRRSILSNVMMPVLQFDLSTGASGLHAIEISGVSLRVVLTYGSRIRICLDATCNTQKAKTRG